VADAKACHMQLEPQARFGLGAIEFLRLLDCLRREQKTMIGTPTEHAEKRLTTSESALKELAEVKFALDQQVPLLPSLMSKARLCT